MALLDNDELTGIDNDADDWQFVSLGEQQNFGIKTAGMIFLKIIFLTKKNLWFVCLQIFVHIFITGLEDKATACQMLVCYARELKEHFVEYTEDTVKLMVPMLKFYFHDGVRSAAAESLPCLIGEKNMPLENRTSLPKIFNFTKKKLSIVFFYS